MRSDGELTPATDPDGQPLALQQRPSPLPSVSGAGQRIATQLLVAHRQVATFVGRGRFTGRRFSDAGHA